MFDKNIILIDDAENLDRNSWKILDTLLKVPGVLVVLSLSNAMDFIDSWINTYIRKNVVTLIRLENLKDEQIAPLICQMLGVEAVPLKLVRWIMIILNLEFLNN